jgi:hypothetical protein
MIARPTNPYETATGRVVGSKLTDNGSLYHLCYVDGKPGNLPEKYSGLYTSPGQVDVAIRSFVEETFQVAEESIGRAKGKV